MSEQWGRPRWAPLEDSSHDVLWCEVHNHQANAVDCCVNFFGDKAGGCHIKKMRLVPVDALVTTLHVGVG